MPEEEGAIGLEEKETTETARCADYGTRLWRERAIRAGTQSPHETEPTTNATGAVDKTVFMVNTTVNYFKELL